MGYRNFSKVRLERRLRFAREWNSRYGPEDLQFRVIDEDRAKSMKEKLNENELNALKKIADELDKKWKPKELHKRIYEIARGLKIKPENLFKIIYLVLIGKEKGPKAAMFLLSLDRNLVKRRFK
ncbi:MAG: lysine--tRNA ligase, partial [Candidatus Altiarchaeales archaeon]